MHTSPDKPNGPVSIYVIGIANLLLGIVFAGFYAVNLMSQSAMQPAPTWVRRAIMSSEIAHFWFDWLAVFKGSLAIVSSVGGGMLLRDNRWGRTLTIFWAIASIALNVGSVAVMYLCVVPTLRHQIQEAGGSGANASSAAFGALIVAAIQSCYPAVIWYCMQRRSVTSFFHSETPQGVDMGPPPAKQPGQGLEHGQSDDNPYRV